MIQFKPILAFVYLSACAEKIGEEKSPIDDATEQANDLVAVVLNDDGSFAVTIDATDREEWVYWSFDSESALSVEDPETDLIWSMGFMRNDVKLNGGVSGIADVSAAVLDAFDWSNDINIDDLAFTSDIEVEEGVYEYALKDWYDYDLATHTLSPADRIYVIRVSEAEIYKLRFDDYYDGAGTPAYVQFTWESL